MMRERGTRDLCAHACLCLLLHFLSPLTCAREEESVCVVVVVVASTLPMQGTERTHGEKGDNGKRGGGQSNQRRKERTKTKMGLRGCC